MRKAFFILLLLICNSLFSQNYRDTSSLKELTLQWNAANNQKDIMWLSQHYSSSPLFYGKNVTKEKALDIKRYFFTKNKTFHQEIVSLLRFSFYKSGIIKCSFDKKVYYAAHEHEYPSYLLFEKKDDNYYITGESDLITDSNTGFKPDLEKEIIKEPAGNSSVILIVALIVAAAGATVYIVAKKRKPAVAAVPASVNTQLSQPAVNVPVATADKLSKKKGDDFEKYVTSLFIKPYFEIYHWRSDKMYKGVYATSNMHPDLEVIYRDKNNMVEFAVECKYRSALIDPVRICKDYQLRNY